MIRTLLLADALAPSTETSIITAIATFLAVLIGALIRAFAKDSREKEEQRRQMIIHFAKGAYLITAEVAALTETKLDDKIAVALHALHEQLAAQGAPPATYAEKLQARLIWKAMHGEEKIAEKFSGAGPAKAPAAAVEPTAPAKPEAEGPPSP